MFRAHHFHAHHRRRMIPSLQAGAAVRLSQVTGGSRARIVQMEGGRRLRKRLADLGLSVGMEVRVLRDAYGHGPMIIAVRHDTRLALGWGLAAKITVCIEE